MILLNVFTQRFNEGGPVIMSLILICLILALIFLVLGFRNKIKNPDKTKKMLILTMDVSLLGLVIGFLGAVLGLIEAFDTLESLHNTDMMASGLKVSFLTTVFGAFTFIVSRIGILILRASQK